MRRWSFKSQLWSFGYAFKGLKWMMTTQNNAWIHLMAAFVVILLSFYFHISRIEWLFIIFSIGLVFMAEMFNTVIEILTDMVSPEINEKAGKIKDIAAGAVLITAFTSIIVGGVIFVPKILVEIGF